MLKRLFTYFLFLFSLSCFSQHFVLSGVVVDENKLPIPFSNVVVYIASDLSFVAGTTSNEQGEFQFENLKPNNYSLKISFVGYKDNNRPIDLIKSLNIGVIVLKEEAQALDGVTIIAKRPTVKRLVDRLVFNVENSTLSNNNVIDVLKHTPKILMVNEDISVNGSEPTIYINDRKVYLSSKEVYQLLQGTSATNIKSIEVITSPPAKYEAEGGSVINIVTSKNIVSGYNGSVFGDYKQGFEYGKYSLGTSHFFKTKKINAYINYNISPRKDFKYLDEDINFFDTSNNIVSKWETNSKEIKQSSNQNLNTNIDYNFNEYNSVGFSASTLIYPREHTKAGINSNTEVFSSNNVLDSTFNTINNSVKETLNFAFTLDYTHKFKREGEKLSANMHHTNYDYSIYQNVDTDYFLANTNLAPRKNKFQTFSSQKIKIFTGQLDYELPINDSSLFETGFKASTINSESILNQFIFKNGEKEEDLENSDMFLYDETNYAGYLSYSKDWAHWSIKSGLRVEYTNITGSSLSTMSLNTNNYVKFFPSLHILHKLNDKNELYFTYNRRILRPRYDKLNPFKFYYSDNSYITGDPNLKPQLNDQVAFGYSLNKTFNFELYYYVESNPTLQIIFQDNNNNILKYINTNIDKSVMYGIEFTSNIKIMPNWNLDAYLYYFYNDNQFYALESNNSFVKNGKWTFWPQINNNILFLKDKSLSADFSFYFMTPYAEGASIASPRSYLDITIRKSLWNNRASISMGVTDVFNTLNFNKTSKYLNQDTKFSTRAENRLFVLGFNYKFGNYRLLTNKTDLDSEERDRLNIEN